MDITELLRFAVSEEASDIHVSSGEPPIMRIHGSMKRLDHPALSQDDVHRMIYDIMSDKQRKDFEESNELDFSFEMGKNVFVSMPLSSVAENRQLFVSFPPPSCPWSSWVYRASSRNSANMKRASFW